MEAEFCVDCLEEALRTHGKPEIFAKESIPPPNDASVRIEPSVPNWNSIPLGFRQ